MNFEIGDLFELIQCLVDQQKQLEHLNRQLKELKWKLLFSYYNKIFYLIIFFLII
jgi:hypothetical protein